MLIETFLIEKLDNKSQNNSNKYRAKKYFLAFLNLTLAIIAGYLCWNCNKNEPAWLKILYTIIAVIFSGFYMLYYLIYRVIINVPCKVKGNSLF